MLRLLHESTRAGYPMDYLVSRIHGRIQRQVLGDADFSAGSGTFLVDDTSIWDAAAGERRWIYQQMEADLRKTVSPLLLYFELDGLILVMRYLGSDNAAESDAVLEKSILADALKKIVQGVGTPVEVISKMEKYLASSHFSLKGLAAAYEEGGVQQCEEIFRTRFLQQVLFFCNHQVVKNFFRTTIDQRNTITMSKSLRWGKHKIENLIDGGNIRLRTVDLVPTEAGLRKMVQRLTGKNQLTSAELLPINLEPLLYNSLSKIMNRQMRSINPVQCCSGYIWHCFITSRKRSQEYHGGRFKENFPDSGVSLQ